VKKRQKKKTENLPQSRKKTPKKGKIRLRKESETTRGRKTRGRVEGKKKVEKKRQGGKN